MHLQALSEKAQAYPNESSSIIFRKLLDALEHDAPFDLQQLDQLSYGDFDTVLNALREWRSQRYVWLREHDDSQPWRSHLS